MIPTGKIRKLVAHRQRMIPLDTTLGVVPLELVLILIRKLLIATYLILLYRNKLLERSMIATKLPFTPRDAHKLIIIALKRRILLLILMRHLYGTFVFPLAVGDRISTKTLMVSLPFGRRGQSKMDGLRRRTKEEANGNTRLRKRNIPRKKRIICVTVPVKPRYYIGIDPLLHRYDRVNMTV